MKQNIKMRRDRGVGLVELMIAIVLGMLVVLGALTIFERNSSTRYEIERNTRQLGNGHYASKLLADDIRLAGYLSSFYKATAPGVLPANPCSTVISDLQANFSVFLQGYDNSSGALSCLTDYRSGTDVIVVRRASACTAANPAETNCTAITANLPYLQASGCVTDAVPFKLDTNTANLNLKKVGCVNPASIHRMYTHIYYVANNNQPGDGIPTLKLVDVDSAATPVSLVEGIENVQYEYGLDTNGDGSPDTYTSNPGTVAAWANVVTVKVHLLSRNDTISPGYTDNKFYMLGGTRVPASGTFGDGYRRHVYSTTSIIENSAGRRQ